MPSVLIAKDDGVALLDFDLRPGKAYVLGRSSAADVRLEAQSISRLHAILFQHDGAWRLTDLGSRKGLRTEEGPVRDHELVHGGWVAVGPAVIWFFDEQAEAKELQENPPEEPPQTQEEQKERTLQILMIQRPDSETPHAVALTRKSISIGSSSQCEVTLDVPSLNDVHLLIFRLRGIWHAAAIDESNLIDSDGMNTQCAVLSANNTIQAGPLTLSLMDTHVPPNPPQESVGQISSISGLSAEAEADPLDIDLEGLEGNGGRRKRPSAPNH